jgi:SAM-dependent methyltransferase
MSGSDSGSVGFDRAAAYYDATRALPPETHRAMIEAMAAELRDRGVSLEIGVGTGRVALPLAQKGIEIVGVDISEPMIHKLVEKAGRRRPIGLALADATRLPFDDGSFGSAYGVHILHLIEDWRSAARELLRVVRPGGVILFELGNADKRRKEVGLGSSSGIEERFLAEAGVTRRFRGIDDAAELDALMSEHGAIVRELEPMRGELSVAPGVVISLFEHGSFSCAWDIPEDTRRRAADAVRAWYLETQGDLETPRPYELAVALRAYDLPRRT